MALGFNIEWRDKNDYNVEIFEGIIKDRYDDFDHMIDYSDKSVKINYYQMEKPLNL